MNANFKSSKLINIYELSIEDFDTSKASYLEKVELVTNLITDIQEIDGNYSIKEDDYKALSMLYDTSSFNECKILFSESELTDINNYKDFFHSFFENVYNPLVNNILPAFIAHTDIQLETISDLPNIVQINRSLSDNLNKATFMTFVEGGELEDSVLDKIYEIFKTFNAIYLSENIDYDILDKVINKYSTAALIFLSTYARVKHCCLRIAEFLLKKGEELYSDEDYFNVKAPETRDDDKVNSSDERSSSMKDDIEEEEEDEDSDDDDEDSEEDFEDEIGEEKKWSPLKKFFLKPVTKKNSLGKRVGQKIYDSTHPETAKGHSKYKGEEEDGIFEEDVDDLVRESDGVHELPLNVLYGKSNEDYQYGLEVKADFNKNKKEAGAKGSPIDTLKNMPAMINQVNKKFTMFRRKAKNAFFFRKYQGRIDGLYEHYADEAMIKENRMYDDPVMILKEKATEYINTFVENMNKLYEELKNLYEKTESTKDVEQAFKILCDYMGNFAPSIEYIKKTPQMMAKATKTRIAKYLFQDNKIYGYTVESVVEKSLPPANHAIVALFMSSAHEAAVEQSVSDVFKSIDSFRLIMANEKQPIFDTQKISHNLLRTGIQSSDIKAIRTAKRLTLKELRGANASHAAKQNAGDEDSNEKELNQGDKTVRQYAFIWKGIEKSMSEVVKMKHYVAKLIDAYFVMMMRIDNLCKIAITALLAVEASKKVKGHNTGFRGEKLGDDGGIKARGLRQYRQLANDEQKLEGAPNKFEQRQDRKADRKERMDNLRNIIKENNTGIINRLKH